MSELVARLRNRMLNILAGPRPSLNTDELEQKVRRAISEAQAARYREALERITTTSRYDDESPWTIARAALQEGNSHDPE